MSLYLVDGYNFVFRAFYSVPPFTTSTGIPVGAVYGFIKMITKLLKDNNCSMLLIALDPGKKLFRHEIYEQYKANRRETHESLKKQFPIIREAIKALNIKYVEVPGFEADDIIASYVKVAIKNGIQVKIISSDKDFIQLLSPNVTIFYPLKRKIVDEDHVWNKFGIKPEQMIDFLAMTGYVSDNIPVIKKIGPVTAAKLLGLFKNLDGIYRCLERIQPERLRKLVTDGKAMAYLSQRLVTLQNEGFALPYTLEDLSYKNAEAIVLQSFLQKYELERINPKKTIFSKEEDKTNACSHSVKVVTSNDLAQMYEQISNYGEFYCYINTRKFSCFFGTLIYVVNVEEDIQTFFSSIESFIKLIASERAIKFVTFFAKEFMSQFPNIQFKSYDDLSLLLYILNTGSQIICLNKVLEELDIPSEEVNAYTMFVLAKNLRQKLLSEKQMYLYEDVEKPVLSLLLQIEKKGVLVCHDTLKSLSNEFNVNIINIETKIYELTGEKFNIASPKQVGIILFDKLKILGGKKSKKSDAYSTDAETLENIAASGNVLVQYILQWRRLTKLTNTYTNPLLKNIAPDGRVHTTFSMISTSTSRLSSSSPNLQNIPVKTIDGNRIRKAFIASAGHQIVTADYSQIELRVLAHIAGITILQDAFMCNKDIHKITASQVFNIPLTKITTDLRRRAKTINFGIIYGMSTNGLAARLGIEKKAAQDYINAYFIRYPGIKEYMKKTISAAQECGYVKTIMGRKCFIDKINDPNVFLRRFAERAAINAPIQGSATEIIKKAMVNMDVELRRYLLLQIHDELLFEIPTDLVRYYSQIITQTMQSAVVLSVPLVVDIGAGKSWSDAKKVS